MNILCLLLMAYVGRFTLGAKVETDTSIWQMMEMAEELANSEDKFNMEVEKELKTLNENLKQLLSGNFSNIPSIFQAEKKQKVPVNVQEPKDETTDRSSLQTEKKPKVQVNTEETKNEPSDKSSHNTSCSCSNFINRNGFGRCKRIRIRIRISLGLQQLDWSNCSCYVNLPTNCPDLIKSHTNPGKYLSAKACKSGSPSGPVKSLELTTTKPKAVRIRWSNCPKQVTIDGIDDVEGLYIRQPELVNGKVYYQATQEDICISWDKMYQHWWIQKCRSVGHNVGLAYLGGQDAECPNANSQDWISVYERGQRIDGAQVKEYFCQAVDGKECIFPTKWGSSTYYSCSFNGAFGYKWCATSIKPNGEYTAWNYCNPNYKCSASPPKRGSSKEKQKPMKSFLKMIFGQIE